MPKGAPNSAAMYGISLARNKWVVNLRRRRRIFSKTFAHSTYGGAEAALAAAQAWRDETARQNPQTSRREQSERLISTNTSGIPGVRCRLGPDGKPQLWMVQTRIGGKALLKSFSVGRYGDMARSLAIAEREKHLACIEGRLSRNPADQVTPDAPPVPPERWLTKAVRHTEVLRRNNKSGVVGVRCRTAADGTPLAWVAKTKRGDITLFRQFSVKEFGAEQAWQMAIDEKRRQVEKLDGATKVPE